MELSRFVELHEPQLESLSSNLQQASDSFPPPLPFTVADIGQVTAARDLDPETDVFLASHWLTFKSTVDLVAALRVEEPRICQQLAALGRRSDDVSGDSVQLASAEAWRLAEPYQCQVLYLSPSLICRFDAAGSFVPGALGHSKHQRPAGEPLFRNYISTASEEQRDVFRPAFLPDDHLHDDLFIDAYKQFLTTMEEKALEGSKECLNSTALQVIQTQPAKVYSDMPQVLESLKLCPDQFTITDTITDADIVWTGISSPQVLNEQLSNHFTTDTVINSLPEFASLIYDYYGSAANVWYPTTYNLNTQTREFLGHWLSNKQILEDNTWIVEPWKRSMDDHPVISSNLGEILKQLVNGPKIVSKYVNPVATIDGRKFEVEVMVLVQSISPVHLFTSDFLVLPRLSKHAHQQSDQLEHREIMESVRYEDFQDLYEREYGLQKPWSQILHQIHSSIFQVFTALGEHAKDRDKLKRGLYKTKFIFHDEGLEPFLIDITPTFNDQHLMAMDPGFYSKAFQLLFYDSCDDTEYFVRIGQDNNSIAR